MISKKAFVMLAVLVFLPLSVNAGENPSIKGAYTQLPGYQFNFDGKQIEVIEFLSFYCHACYGLERSIPIIKGNFPKKIKWKIIPIYWGKGSPKPSEAYLLAEEAGKGEQMAKAIFNANFVERKDIGNVEVLESIGVELGFSFEFSRRLRGGDKAQDVQKAMDMVRAYNINETPTLIIAGNIMTNPHAFNNFDAFRENVITIIKSILKQ